MRRRPRISILVAAATLLLSSTVPANAQDAEGAFVDKVGWWNALQVRQPTPAAPVTVAPPRGIPEGDIAVGSDGNDPTAIAAVGIQPDAKPGATVLEFTMSIAEDPEADGNQGTEAPTVVIGACPITAFWAAAEGGEFENRPDFDCEPANAVGERDDEGVWTFDLAPIGAIWLDPFGTIRADGVVLLPSPDSNAVFQAVFDPETIQITLTTSGGTDFDGGGFGSPTPTTSTTQPSDTGFASPGTSGGGSSVIARPTIPSATPPTTAAPTTTTTAVPLDDGSGSDDGETAAPPAAEPPISEIGNLRGNLPGVVIPAVILFAALFLAMSYWLGPAGEPKLHVRQRGVSRALEQRARRTQGL